MILQGEASLEHLLLLNVPPIHTKLYSFLDSDSRRALSEASTLCRDFVRSISVRFAGRERLRNWSRVRRPHRVPVDASARGPIMLSSPPVFCADDEGDLYMATKDCAAKFVDLRLRSYQDWSDGSAGAECELLWAGRKSAVFVVRSEKRVLGGEEFRLSVLDKDSFRLVENEVRLEVSRAAVEAMREFDEVPLHGSTRGSLEVGGGTAAAWSAKPNAFVTDGETGKEVRERIEKFGRILEDIQGKSATDCHKIACTGKHLAFLTQEGNLELVQLPSLETIWKRRISNVDLSQDLIHLKLKRNYILFTQVSNGRATVDSKPGVGSKEWCSASVLDIDSGRAIWEWGERVFWRDPRFRAFAFRDRAVVTTPGRSDVRLTVYDLRRRSAWSGDPRFGLVGGYQGVACSERLMLLTGLRSGRMTLFAVDLDHGGATEGAVMNAVDWTPPGMCPAMEVCMVAEDGVVVEERMKWEKWEEGSAWKRPLSRLCFLVMNRSREMYRIVSSRREGPGGHLRLE